MQNQILSKVQLTLDIISSLAFPLDNQDELKTALQQIPDSSEEIRFCKKMLVGSMTPKDFPLLNTLEAFEKFYIVIGETTTFQSKFFSNK